MITIFWDIDGTLLTTAKAGVPAWETAVMELTGRSFQLSSMRVPGLTDYQIAVRTFELLDVPADDALIARLVKRYETLLPETLPTKQGRVLPHVREILDRCRTRTDIKSYLLTGNTQGGARAKLTHYDLWHYFPEGAFAEDTRPRSTIAERGLALAKSHGPVDPDRVFVIGDTPHDVHCADAIGARTVAVATGGYTEAELQEHRPWCVCSELPDADVFLEMLETPRPLTPGQPSRG